MKSSKVLALQALLSWVVLVCLSACSTPGRSVGAGAGVGAVAGAGVGALAYPGRHGENRVRNVVIGSAVGAAVGAGAGYLADRYVRSEREDAARDAKTEAAREANNHAGMSAGHEPKLLPARTEARWVPDQIRGQAFIPGHFEYVIIEGARWDTGK